MEIESVYAFIDESGTVGAKTGTRFLIIVSLSVKQPRVIELTIRRAIKKYGSKIASGEIKAADAVAWSLFQKYERNDSRFYDVIVSKIVIENVVDDW